MTVHDDGERFSCEGCGAEINPYDDETFVCATTCEACLDDDVFATGGPVGRLAVPGKLDQELTKGEVSDLLIAAKALRRAGLLPGEERSA